MNSAGHNFLSRHEELIAEHRRLLAEAERLRAEVRQKIEHLEWLVDSVRREWRTDFFRPLQDAIRTTHGCESRHLAVYAVRKVRDGRTLWAGMVDEFAMVGAAGGDTCYAWQYAENGQPHTFTVLKQGPVDTPQAAVQLFLRAKDAPRVTSVLA